MTLDDKRKVIEVLLCAGCIWNPNLIIVCLEEFNIGLEEMESIRRLRREAMLAVPDTSDRYEDSCIEAAYRLIESSPTLRREWFGAS